MKRPPVRVALPKLFLWSEPGRFEEYPAALARAQEGRVYTRAELEREVFDWVPASQFPNGAPRSRGTDGVGNCFGLTRGAARYCIGGINLFEQMRKGVRVTQEGLALGASYRNASKDSDWVRALARQLLSREPRTRLVTGLCLAGWQLGVKICGGVPRGPVCLLSPTGKRLEIACRSCEGFNQLLKDRAELALGPAWRKDLIAHGSKGRVIFEGINSRIPSTKDLTTALKRPLAVLFHLGALEGGPTLWRITSAGLADALGIDDLAPFGFEGQRTQAALTDDDAFVRALGDCADSDGYLVVSKLAERFGELLNTPIDDRALGLDRFVRGAMYHDRCRVLDRHRGQPRMGRGLFGESDSRRIRVDFSPMPIGKQSVADAQIPVDPATGKKQGEIR